MFGAIQTRVPSGKAGDRETKHLLRELPPDLIEPTCNACPLLATKQGNEPTHLSFAINAVSRLENKKAIGLQLVSITPFQQAAMLGAEQGRNRSEANRLKKDDVNENNPTVPEIPAGMGRLD